MLTLGCLDFPCSSDHQSMSRPHRQGKHRSARISQPPETTTARSVGNWFSELSKINCRRPILIPENPDDDINKSHPRETPRSEPGTQNNDNVILYINKNFVASQQKYENFLTSARPLAGGTHRFPPAGKTLTASTASHFS